MPSITDPQWSAIRRTAAAVAREVANEIINSAHADSDKVAAAVARETAERVVSENMHPVFQEALRQERSRKKPSVSGQHPEFREGTKCPPCLPTSEFYLVADAACYPYGGSPTRNLPYLTRAPGTVMHGTERDAWEEATRLSRELQRPFVVLKAVGTVVPTSVPAKF